MSEGEVSEERFRVLEGVVYFVDPKSPGSFSYLGGKERIRIPLKREHDSLDAFKRHIVEHAGLKTEAEKRAIGSSIDLKLCRLVKSAEGSKAVFSLSFSSAGKGQFLTGKAKKLHSLWGGGGGGEWGEGHGLTLTGKIGNIILL